MRMLTDGHKRRPPAAATAPLKTALSLAKQSSGSLTSDSNAVIRRRDRSPAVRRPQRKVGAPSALTVQNSVLLGTFLTAIDFLENNTIKDQHTVSEAWSLVVVGGCKGSFKNRRVCHNRRLAGRRG